MNPMWLLRAVNWVRHPPSQKRVVLVVVIVAACLAIWGAEQVFGFPEWLRPNNLRNLSR
ncbi:hypothetical protein [Pseudooceanicola sediminis]|mgnify:CR=1 FL=1|uniref:hypothetical protein n=1 Tax=Pseudooceanicola sediminis TaxID=2211117 RepID=UPI0018F443AA|nr:hypothetical protein [Pseudooceanicola sediminis]|tara:strand:- start:9906 stop:10082 length:177 start_codon:yes stop_codon:yes gene_type:complete